MKLTLLFATNRCSLEGRWIIEIQYFAGPIPTWKQCHRIAPRCGSRSSLLGFAPAFIFGPWSRPSSFLTATLATRHFIETIKSRRRLYVYCYKETKKVVGLISLRWLHSCQSSHWEWNWIVNGKSAVLIQPVRGFRLDTTIVERGHRLLPMLASSSLIADSAHCHLQKIKMQNQSRFP